ncbi:MAG: hypothetical protein GY906_39090 [bacterium]|nr:hypothetical protein [bacterium]
MSKGKKIVMARAVSTDDLATVRDVMAEYGFAVSDAGAVRYALRVTASRERLRKRRAAERYLNKSKGDR